MAFKAFYNRKVSTLLNLSDKNLHLGFIGRHGKQLDQFGDYVVYYDVSDDLINKYYRYDTSAFIRSAAGGTCATFIDNQHVAVVDGDNNLAISPGHVAYLDSSLTAKPASTIVEDVVGGDQDTAVNNARSNLLSKPFGVVVYGKPVGSGVVHVNFGQNVHIFNIASGENIQPGDLVTLNFEAFSESGQDKVRLKNNEIVKTTDSNKAIGKCLVVSGNRAAVRLKGSFVGV